MQAYKRADAINKKVGSAIYIQPKDRKGKFLTDMLSTEPIEEALQKYREACEAAQLAVRGELQALARNLEVSPSPDWMLLHCNFGADCIIISSSIVVPHVPATCKMQAYRRQTVLYVCNNPLVSVMKVHHRLNFGGLT